MGKVEPRMIFAVSRPVGWEAQTSCPCGWRGSLHTGTYREDATRNAGYEWKEHYDKVHRDAA